jgi:hypothetical protein
MDDVFGKPLKNYYEYASVWAWLRSPEGGACDVKQREIQNRSPRQVASLIGKPNDEKIIRKIVIAAGRILPQ